ncbi:inhibin alpha chain [Chanos chanos]|uniref:Inhibin alpha chain n=1 Tax=Chanos chanos TaxID=29144 RepID=A0A6J2W2L3_CHACN|nr:inhibin alpha chain [Chanos chanos]
MWNRYLSALFCVQFLLALWSPPECQACQGDELPRTVVLDWLRHRILEGLGLKEPPVPVLQRPPGVRMEMTAHHRGTRVSRATWVNRKRLHQESSQVILFPSSESTCQDETGPSSEASTGHFTYYFQPSLDNHESIIVSAHFWFYAGEGVASDNSSAPLYILTANQELLLVADRPAKRSPDGWTTYQLEYDLHPTLGEGPLMLQVRCPACSCHRQEEDKTPFLHLHTRPRVSDRSRRAPTVPWSPVAIEKLQRPWAGGAEAAEGESSDCRREQIEISFQELGWDNWIIHPKVFSFHYCHGNCSSPERTTTLLGISQCCAPVPESMKSLRFTTTSDGGFSFKYETLPNIIPEECNCI